MTLLITRQDGKLTMNVLSTNYSRDLHDSSDAHVKNALYKSLNQKLQSHRDEHSRLGALLEGMGGPGQAKTSRKEKAKLQKQHDKHTLAIWELEDQRETWIAFKDSTIESSRTWFVSITIH